MSKMKLRTKIPMNYYEPSFDENVYCDQCRDFVYEYCSIHGPLLVIPDNEVPLRPDYPAFVPRAALTTPNEFVHIAPSIIPGAGLGVFATLTLPSGVRFGPFRGIRSKHITSQYCWKIQDSIMRFKHAIDASDANNSNWMRYVNCARHWHEQNLVAYQYRGQIYYRAVKLIPRFTELMVFYGSEYAVNLNIDLKNYNSDVFCQKIANRKLIMDTNNYGRINHFIEKTTNEDSNINMSFQELENVKDNDLIKTTIDDFVIIDTPLDSLDSKPHEILNPMNQNCMVPKSSEMAQTINKNNALTCNVCQKTFPKPYNLKRHSKIHNINRNLINNVTIDTHEGSIDRKFHINQQNCMVPQTLPSETNRKFCKICQKNFTRLYDLKKHIIRVHKAKLNESNSKVLLQQKDSTLLTDKSNTTSNTLKCNVCNRFLSSKKCLRKHMLTHSEKRYSCTKCTYKTNHMYVLKNHNIQIHDKIILYYCDMCSYNCSMRKNIVNHLRKQHK